MKVHIHINELIKSSAYSVVSKEKTAPSWYDALVSAIKGSLRKLVLSQVRIGQYSSSGMFQMEAYKEHALTANNFTTALGKRNKRFDFGHIFMYGKEKSGQEHFYIVEFFPIEKECSSLEKIVNPATGRCVKIDGAIGRKLLGK